MGFADELAADLFLQSVIHGQLHVGQPRAQRPPDHLAGGRAEGPGAL